MKQGIVIGVTGPSGAGKSTVCEITKKYGAYVIDADVISRNVLNGNKSCRDKIIESFQDDILNDDGSISRKKLARAAFASEKKTGLLNSIIHPIIVDKIKKQVYNNKLCNKFVVIDAALLFECGLQSVCDVVWCVIAPVKERITRVIMRDGISKSDAVLRINIQKQDDFYKSQSCILIDGTADMNLLNTCVRDSLEKYNPLV